MSKILIIDTATKYIYLSLIIDGKIKQTIYQEGINNHSVTIIPMLNDILDKEDITLPDIDELIIGIGPGSYTGVRIGVTVAKMIGYLNHISVKTISSLALIASASDNDIVIPMIDARRGNAFIAAFKQENGTLIRLKEDSLSNVKEYLSQCEQPYAIVESGIPQAEKVIYSDLMHRVEDIHELTPNYLQKTEAERNKNENQHT